MTEHQKAILRIKQFLLHQLEENMRKEFDMAKDETESIRDMHLAKAAQYNRRIARAQRELLVFKEKSNDKKLFRTEFTGASYR